MPRWNPRLWTDEQRLAGATLLGLAVLVAAVCVAKPGESPWLPPCPFHALTGLYCPGCGSTRMLYWLVHGHPLLAAQQNPLAMLVLPWIVWRLCRQAFPQKSPAPRWDWRWGMAFAALLVVFTVARNAPSGPLCKLAPGGVCAVWGVSSEAKAQLETGR